MSFHLYVVRNCLELLMKELLKDPLNNGELNPIAEDILKQKKKL